MYVHCVIITLVLMQSVSCMGTYIPAEVCTSYVQPGDIYLGGIFSLHGGADGEYSKEDCEGLYPVSALQLTEAMAFAVMTINQDDSVLPNVTLGFIIHDDCSWPEYSTWGSLSLVLGAQPSLEGDSCIIPGPTIGGDIKRVIGIVGTGETYTTEVAINTAQLFQRPLVSYGATDQELHGEHGHPYFFGTIPSDSYKASAIVDILLYFEWEYIAMIFSDDHEIHHLEEDIVNLLEVFGICLYAEAELSEDPTEDELQQMVAMLQTHPHAKLVVVLVSSASAFSAVMSSVQSAYPPLERTWLSSDTWEKELIGNAEALGGLFIQFRKPEIMEFEEYFRSLLEGNETSNINPWFYEFCGGSDICHEASQEGFSKELPTLAPTIDAVLALAYALDDTILALSCNGSITDCLLRDKNIQRSILENLRTVEFFGTRGDFYFEHDFVPAQVIVKNLQRSNEGNLELVEVGTWSSTKPYWEQLEINSSLLQWAGGTGDVPISVCRDECNPGYIEVIDFTKRCCWKCQACRVDDIVVGTECVSCQQNEWPNMNFTMCEKIIGRTVTWHDPAVVFLSFMTSLGLLLSIVTSCGMIRYRNHALIKASSRELSAVNIFGLILAFVSVFPLLLPPTAGICGVAQSMYALSFTLMYAPLLLKVNRIYRIFESSRKTVKRPQFTGSTAQLVIVALFVITQVSTVILRNKKNLSRVIVNS